MSCLFSSVDIAVRKLPRDASAQLGNDVPRHHTVPPAGVGPRPAMGAESPATPEASAQTPSLIPVVCLRAPEPECVIPKRPLRETFGQESRQQPTRHRDYARLQCETEEVWLNPTLGDPPFLQAVDGDRGPRDRLPRGGDAHEFPEVRAAQGHSLDDVVPFGDEIIDRF